MDGTLTYSGTEQLARIVNNPGMSITAFEAALKVSAVDVNQLKDTSQYGNIESWFNINTGVIANKVNSTRLYICINPTEFRYNLYPNVYAVYLRYIINNYYVEGANNSQDGKLRILAGVIYLKGNGNDIIPIKYTNSDGSITYNLPEINNVIEIPLKYNYGSDERDAKIACDLTCLGDEQVEHYDSSWYDKVNYYRASEFTEKRFLDKDSVSYELMKNKMTMNPMSNFNTMRLTFEGINR